jgi:hypothetical protein
MTWTKVGRNELCPCGSGKKYKKCCGMLDELIDAGDDPFTRSSKLMTAAKIKLDNYYDHLIKSIRQDAQKQFLRFTVTHNLPREHESIFSDWLWFDLLTEDENTLAYHYIIENSDYMAASLRDCLAGLSLSFLSVYQVEALEGSYLKVRDIFGEGTCSVLLKEPWQGVDQDADLLLLGRLVETEGEIVFSGMALTVDNKTGQKDFLLEHMNFIGRLLNEPMTNVLKFHGEMLYGVFDHICHKTLVNFNDMRGCEINADEKALLLKAWAEDKDLLPVHNTGDCTWFKPAREHCGYVRLMVGNRELLCCADVLEDIVYLQEKAAALLPDKEVQVFSNRFRQQPPPPDKSRLWFTAVKDQETERWLDSAMAELEGKTPRQYLAADNGKEQLLQILDNFTAARDNHTEKELIQYMRERVSNY